MTIGIAAAGVDAGAGILEALETAEMVSCGAIRGFVSAVAVFENELIRYETQTNGSKGLIPASNFNKFEQADLAGLISSGPNRPPPLASYVAAHPGVGLVTGHRMPNTTGHDGLPMNSRVLEMLGAGVAPETAVNTVVTDNPTADCGLIAVNQMGQGYAANTACVTRPDAGSAYGKRSHAAVWVLHNAVQPVASLGSLLVEVALNRMQPVLVKTGAVTFKSGTPVESGPSTGIYINEDHVVIKVVTSDKVNNNFLRPLDIDYQPAVFQQGKPCGKLLYEPLLIVQNGKVLSADGESKLNVDIGVPSIYEDVP